MQQRVGATDRLGSIQWVTFTSSGGGSPVVVSGLNI